MSRQFSQQAPAQPRRLNSNGAPPLSANGSVMNHNGASHSNNGSASPGASSNNLYQQLIDSSDLVKELDDIEAISQQISQHAEVLYQNWKSNSQPRQSTPTKVSSTSTTYGAGVGFPKRSILENGVKNGNGISSAEAAVQPQKVSPLSSPTATLTSPSFINKSMPKTSVDLMPPPEVNGNLKDLVNSFVSTDRAKQAARQTISSTITNQMNKRNHFRSPSPTSSTTSTQSPFSSRGVSPLRSPMLVGNPPPPERRLMDAFPTNASIMNSVHTKMPPMFNNEEQQVKKQQQLEQVQTGSSMIRIPVQHLPSVPNSTEEHLRSPSILSTALSSPTHSVVTSLPSQHPASPRNASMPSLHAAHVENMKKRFEEAKERINAMHQRAAAGQPFPFLGNSGSADPFGSADELDFFSRIRRPQRPLIAPPHPELTPQQKQHIVDINNSAQQVPKRFGGSVAERVMIFERCPIVNNDSKDKLMPTQDKSSRQPLSNAAMPAPAPPAPSTLMASTNNIESVPNNSAAPWRSLHQDGKLQTPRAKGFRDIPIATTGFSPSSSSSPTVITSLSSSTTPTATLPSTTSITSTSNSTGGISNNNLTTPLLSTSVFSSPILTPNSRTSSASNSPASTLSRVSRPPSIIVTGKEKVLPKFHFPLGNPATAPSGDLTKFADEFRKHKNSCVSVQELGQILKACGFPLYWKAILFSAAGGDKTGLLSYVAFSDFWRKMVTTHHDEAAQFMHILTFKNQRRNHLAPEDFVPLVQDVVDTHPGLEFLKEATEFHSRYVHTVIARIFFVVNRCWSGFITLSELRRSNLLPTIRLLQEEDDINQITDFFSYEHFYVIYCKFWELDKDHDLFIDREDLSRHNDHAISARMIDRIFSGAVTRGAAQQEGKMSYTEFVWFLLAEEDKRAATSIEYWFRCMDLDGDGFLSMYELEYFYEEQLQRMEQLGIETLPFEDCLCQMLDMIMPKKRNVISLQDLKRCRMTPIFFDTFFNLEKYLDHEQRDPFASQRDVDEDGNEMSDWDRFAAEEYELLVAEEGNAEAMDDMCYEDDPDGNAEMQLEQALDENDLVYHDTMIAASS